MKLSLRNLPEETIEAFKHRAKLNSRSLDAEISYTLRCVIDEQFMRPVVADPRIGRGLLFELFKIAESQLGDGTPGSNEAKRILIPDLGIFWRSFATWTRDDVGASAAADIERGELMPAIGGVAIEVVHGWACPGVLAKIEDAGGRQFWVEDHLLNEMTQVA